MGERTAITEVDILEQWDKLSHAIDRTLTALPGQMTEAAALLEAERRAMRSTLQAWNLSTPKDTGVR